LIRGAILTKYGLEIRFFYSLNAQSSGLSAAFVC